MWEVRYMAARASVIVAGMLVLLVVVGLLVWGDPGPHVRPDARCSVAGQAGVLMDGPAGWQCEWDVNR